MKLWPFNFVDFRVVTGLRFVKDSQIVHIQILEGKLLKYGQTGQNSTSWVSLTNFTILDKGIIDGIDYHTLSHKRRTVDLDDLKAPGGHVVVRFFTEFFLNSLTYL